MTVNRATERVWALVKPHYLEKRSLVRLTIFYLRCNLDPKALLDRIIQVDPFEKKEYDRGAPKYFGRLRHHALRTKSNLPTNKEAIDRGDDAES